jgi:flagellin
MPAVIYTNQASLMAQKGLLGSQNAVANSVERLSSGLRINRAKDDAAGLGVGENLQKQLNGVNQGLHNVNDAISMAQTAEGALSTVSSITQRMLMLATQGANDTLSKEQRYAIGQEIIKLRTAVNDISKRTKYTDTQLFNGAEKKIQVSSLSNDTISLSANDFKNIEISGTSLTPLSTATASVTMKLFLASGGTLNGTTIDSQNNC